MNNSSFRNFIKKLSNVYEINEARAIAFLLFEDFFNISRVDIYADKVRDFSEKEQRLLQEILQRLLKHEPIQYILGHASFKELSFLVTPATLIPRPETEELINWITEDFSSQHHFHLLDIGTGSGCIAISLAKAFAEATIKGCDFSKEALEIARKNNHRHHTNVVFFEQDILKTTNKEEENEESSFDIIVSNPPYICLKEQQDMEENVLLYEPSSALFVPDHEALLFYEAIGHYALQHLKKNGALYLEINQHYGNETALLLKKMGFHSVEIRKDLYDNDRMIKALVK